MVPRREKSFDKSRWWMRSRRTIGFSVMALIDVIILLVIRYGTTNDSDAAGNGMAHAIDIALFEIGGGLRSALLRFCTSSFQAEI